MKNSIILLLLFFISSFSYGQYSDSITIKTPKYVKYLDFRFENGVMMGDGTDLGDQLVNASYYNGLDFRLGFRVSNPDNVYSNVYRRPIIGLGVYSSTFHNEDIGKPDAIYFFMTMPFRFEKAKKLTFSYSAAFGISYNFNAYDSIDNPANLFIGSEKNCYVHLGFLMNYKIGKRLALNGTVGFKHFSNGSLQQPNKGINLIPLTLGVSYKLTEQPEVLLERREIPKYIRHNLWNVTLSAGSKNYYSTDDENHLKMVLTTNYLRQISYKYRVGIGLDFFYSADAEARNNSDDQSAFSKAFSYAVVGSWEWAITEHLYVPLGIGFYLKRNTENDERNFYYERAGIRYRFNSGIHTGLTIKAHGGVADIFEWTVGYTFKHDPNKY